MQHKKKREKIQHPVRFVEEVSQKGKKAWNIIDRKGKPYTVKAGSVPCDKPFQL
jgi:hypothetical protein